MFADHPEILQVIVGDERRLLLVRPHDHQHFPGTESGKKICVAEPGLEETRGEDDEGSTRTGDARVSPENR